MGHQDILELSSDHVENGSTTTKAVDDSILVRNEETEKRLRRKFDIWVLPMGVLIFLFSFIDRTNMGNARILGMTQDTNLTGNRYNIALTMFYVGYIVFEIPSNMACKHFGPRIWLSFITAGFGLTTFAIAFVSSFEALIVLRLLLGIFEAGIQPGIMYSYSQFYKRHELVGRWGIKAAMASIAGSFGGLLSAGFGSIPAVGMMNRWRWIFPFEGMITALFAIVVYFVLPGSIAEARFLSEEDKDYATRRIDEEMMMKKPEHINMKVFKKAIFSLNTQLSALALLCSLCTMTSLSFFMPSVLRSMGYTSITSQLMTVPPYTVSALICVTTAMVSDRIKQRGVLLVVIAPLIPIGFVLLACVNLVGVKYFAIFLATSGAFTLSPILLSWSVENLAGPAVRAVAAGYLVGFGSIGAMISTWSYLAKDSPKYTTGHWTNFGFGILACVVVSVLWLVLKWENEARDDGKRDYRLELPEEEVGQLGHLHPRFRYTT